MAIKPLNVGLVGLGGYAGQHQQSLNTLERAGLCRFVAAADPFADKQPALVNALQAASVQLFPGLDQMLASQDLDAIFIATPIQLHAPQSITALQAGVHVYLEKPPCAVLQDYQAMAAALENSGKSLAIGFQMQHSAAMRYVQQIIANGELGEVRRVWAGARWCRKDHYYNRAPWAARWKVNGEAVFDGPATNALAHVVHGGLSLAAQPGQSAPVLKKVRGCMRRARPVESYDSVFVEAVTEGEVSVRLVFTHATAGHDVATLHCEGTKGKVEINWSGEVRVTLNGEASREFQFIQVPPICASADFLRQINGEATRIVTLQDTLPYLQAVNGAYQSSAGAQDFPAHLINAGEPGPNRFYSVAGLDQQIGEFQADSANIPPLLADTGPWIEVEKIKPEL